MPYLGARDEGPTLNVVFLKVQPTNPTHSAFKLYESYISRFNQTGSGYVKLWPTLSDSLSWTTFIVFTSVVQVHRHCLQLSVHCAHSLSHSDLLHFTWLKFRLPCFEISLWVCLCLVSQSKSLIHARSCIKTVINASLNPAWLFLFHVCTCLAQISMLVECIKLWFY